MEHGAQGEQDMHDVHPFFSFNLIFDLGMKDTKMITQYGSDNERPAYSSSVLLQHNTYQEWALVLFAKSTTVLYEISAVGFLRYQSDKGDREGRTELWK